MIENDSMNKIYNSSGYSFENACLGDKSNGFM